MFRSVMFPLVYKVAPRHLVDNFTEEHGAHVSDGQQTYMPLHPVKSMTKTKD